MDYFEVIKDLNKMKEMQLQSINPGSDITILDVTDSSIVLRSSTGKEIRRSLTEIKKIVKALSSEKPIHVESILGGSGSSRNQPETLLANLPYVEWLRIKKKKHIVWVKERTHPYGSKKEMDPIKASMLKAQVFTEVPEQQYSPDKPISATITFCDELPQAISFYKSLLNIEPEKYNDNHAIFRNNNAVVILRKTMSGVEDGLTGPLILMSDNIILFLQLEDSPYKKITIPADNDFPSQVIIKGPNNLRLILSY